MTSKLLRVRGVRTQLVASSLLVAIWGSGCGDDDVVFPTGNLADGGSSSESTVSAGETSASETEPVVETTESPTDSPTVTPTTTSSEEGLATSAPPPETSEAPDTAGETTAPASSEPSATSAPWEATDAGVTEGEATTDVPVETTMGVPDASVSSEAHDTQTPVETSAPLLTSAPLDTSIALDTNEPGDTSDASVYTDVMPDTDGGMVWPAEDAGEPVGAGGEPIPGDLEIVTEFDTIEGAIGTYTTTDAFESVTPVITDGVARFSIPFDLKDDRFQWVFTTTPSPRNLAGATIAARVRIVSGLTNATDRPGILQLYGNNGAPQFGGTASYNGLTTDGSWQVVEYSLDTAGYNNYTPTAVVSLAFEFRPNAYDNSLTDADVEAAVVEVDWVGLRLPPAAGDAGP